MSVAFGDFIERSTGFVSPAQDFLVEGARVAASIPQPSAENRGMLQAAYWWAYYVGAVFPLSQASPDPEMPHAGKTPNGILGHGWSADTVGSREWAQVTDWWREAPLANIGITTRASGILILDIDPRHDGWASMSSLARECGIDLARVPRSVSPRGDGGAHLWFRVDPEVIAANDDGSGQQGLLAEYYPHSPIARGVDRPWQVPVPPSVRWVAIDPTSKDVSRRNGYRSYVWQAGSPLELPIAPERLLGEGLSQAASIGASVAGAGASESVGGGTGGLAVGRIGPEVVESLVQEGVPVGQQSYVFKRIACSMVRRKYSDGQIVETLAETAARSPVGDAARPWTRADLESMTHHARRYIQSEDRKEAAEAARFGSIVNGFIGGST